MLGEAEHNKSLQRTFVASPTFADAKTDVASNAAEFRRYIIKSGKTNEH